MSLNLLYTVNLAEHWLPAIVNGDTTGLTDEEEEMLDEWLKANPAAVYDYGYEKDFAIDEISGSMSECYEVKIWGEGEC